MTDARFLSNNSVTSEANHKNLKCKTLMQGIVVSIKTLNNKIGQRESAGQLFAKKWNQLFRGRVPTHAHRLR